MLLDGVAEEFLTISQPHFHRLNSVTKDELLQKTVLSQGKRSLMAAEPQRSLRVPEVVSLRILSIAPAMPQLSKNWRRGAASSS